MTTGGFTIANFADVLYESRLVFVLDDELELDAICADIATALASSARRSTSRRTRTMARPALHVAARRGGRAFRSPRRRSLRSRGRDHPPFQRAAGDSVEFRGRPGDEAGDCWIYAVLTPAEWRELDLLAGGVIRLYFAPLK